MTRIRFSVFSISRNRLHLTNRICSVNQSLSAVAYADEVIVTCFLGLPFVGRGIITATSMTMTASVAAIQAGRKRRIRG
jgi:hypothetical protein